MNAPREAVFWTTVDKRPDGCWVWTAHGNNRGYGRFRVGGRQAYAHRVAYELRNGPIPPGLTIDHLCRNKMCVNPAHLEPVTLRENALRGSLARQPTHAARARGGRSGRQKVSEQQVLDIRAKYAAGSSQSALAREYGLTQSGVSRIINSLLPGCAP